VDALRSISSETIQNHANNSIHSDNIEQVLRGSSVLAGGGGGSFQEALQTYLSLNIEEVEVRHLENFSDDAVIATVFGLGPANHETTDPLEIAESSFEAYESRYEDVDGIILGEIGPDLIVEAVAIASQLNIPVVDADVAGMRAVPSIQNEIIEESQISRTPVIATNGEDTVFIEGNDGERLEAEIRQLTDGDIWYVTGYASSPREYEEAAVEGWFEETLRFEHAHIRRIGQGALESVESEHLEGHTVGRMIIQGESTIEIYFQNENLLAYVDGEQVAAAPDTISVIDENGNGVNNGNIPEVGEQLEVYCFSYDFWNDADCFNLETQQIETEAQTFTFQDQLEFDIRGDLE